LEGWENQKAHAVSCTKGGKWGKDPHKTELFGNFREGGRGGRPRARIL